MNMDGLDMILYLGPFFFFSFYLSRKLVDFGLELGLLFLFFLFLWKARDVSWHVVLSLSLFLSLFLWLFLDLT